MLLSVIVPVYNTQNYLRDCLDSLLNQGLNEENYEIICINDGSKDNSLQILEEYTKAYKNIVIINQKNSGVSAARNAGLKIAKGKYIAFCDSDDAVRTGYFSKIITFMEANQVNISVHPVINKINETFTYTDVDIIDSLSVRILPNSFFASKSIFTLILENSFIKDNDLHFNEGMAYGEDTLFSSLAAIEALREKCKIAHVRTPVYYYRKRSGSAMRNVDYAEHLTCMYIMATEYNRTKEKYKNDTRFEMGLNKKISLAVTAVLYDNLRCKKYKPKELFKLLEQNGLYPCEIPFWYLQEKKGKNYIINLLKCTQYFKPLYYIYFAAFRRKKHKN